MKEKCVILEEWTDDEGYKNYILQNLETGELIEAKRCYPISMKIEGLEVTGDESLTLVGNNKIWNMG